MSISVMNPGLISPAVTPAAPTKPVDAGAMNEHLARAMRHEATGAEELQAAKVEAGSALRGAGPGPLPEPTSPPASLDRLREALGTVTGAQQRLDSAIELARSGKSFSPQELLALQAQTHRFAHDLNLISKAVEQVSSGIKKTLDTQV